MGNIVKQDSRSSRLRFLGDQRHIPAQNFLKYPARPPQRLDLNRLPVCLSVTLEAFLVDKFLPLIAGQC